MYKQRRSKNWRHKKTSSNKRENSSDNGSGGKSTYKSKGYKGSSSKTYYKSGPARPYYKSNWKRKNRRRFKETISHSMYISRAEDIKMAAPYVSQRNFNDFGLNEVLTKNISDERYISPTKIQDKAIPEILNGNDILGIGRTGTGKTGAFLIPMIDKALKNPEEKVLIITPTRELASQINAEFRKFAKNTNLRMVLVIGGISIRDQIRLLSGKGHKKSHRSKPQFVVATPGRLIDIEERNCINLRSFNNIVLDEVDQMLDMGFVDDIKMLIDKLAHQRQSLFFSATVNQKGEALANTLLVNPIKVESYKQSPLKTIDQDIVKVDSKSQKIHVLHELLQGEEFNKVLVFSATKIGADNISYELRKKGIMVDSLHGDKSQHKRSRILAKFRHHKIDVLVATDVAARGIDIPDITHVINYDEPSNYTDYIHRIGRTGRIGKKGTALTFVLNKRRYNS